MKTPVHNTYVIANTSSYRRIAKEIVSQHDTVVEIGGSFGKNSEILATRSKQLVIVEHAKDLVEHLESQFKGVPNVCVLWHDARDVYGLIHHVARCDVLFFDIGGDSDPLEALFIFRNLINALRPKSAVIKNIALASTLGNVVFSEFPTERKHERFLSLPKNEEILAHFKKLGKRSAQKFMRRVRHHGGLPSR